MNILLFILKLVLSVSFVSIFEWTLHRYIMHRKLFGFTYAFHAHASVHHQIFKADETYHLQDQKDRYTIPMAWWNGPVLIIMVTTIALGLAECTRLYIVPISRMTVVLWIGSVSLVYFALYESLHWCMHLPRKRRIERTGFFFRLNGHHLLHHRYMNRNFNVVLPLADFLFGTLLLRSPIAFKQARGSQIPDVQPH